MNRPDGAVRVYFKFASLFIRSFTHYGHHLGPTSYSGVLASPRVRQQFIRDLSYSPDDVNVCHNHSIRNYRDEKSLLTLMINPSANQLVPGQLFHVFYLIKS